MDTVRRVMRMWWGQELWWWIRGPCVDALWTGVDLGVGLVAVVERWGVLTHEGVVSKAVRRCEEDLFLIATLLYPTDHRGKSIEKMRLWSSDQWHRVIKMASADAHALCVAMLRRKFYSTVWRQSSNLRRIESDHRIRLLSQQSSCRPARPGPNLWSAAYSSCSTPPPIRRSQAKVPCVHRIRHLLPSRHGPSV